MEDTLVCGWLVQGINGTAASYATEAYISLTSHEVAGHGFPRLVQSGYVFHLQPHLDEASVPSRGPVRAAQISPWLTGPHHCSMTLESRSSCHPSCTRSSYPRKQQQEKHHTWCPRAAHRRRLQTSQAAARTGERPSRCLPSVALAAAAPRAHTPAGHGRVGLPHHLRSYALPPRNGVTVSSHTRDVPGRWAVTLRMSPVTTIFIRRAPPPRRISPQRHGNEAARCAANGSWNVETLLSLRSSPKQKMSTPATSSWDGPVAYQSANTCMWPALGCKRAAAETMLMQSGLALMQQRLHGDHALAGCMGASCWRAFRPLSTPARTSWLCSGENHPHNSHLPGVRDLLNLTQLRVQVRHAGRELGSWITRGYTRSDDPTCRGTPRLPTGTQPSQTSRCVAFMDRL